MFSALLYCSQYDTRVLFFLFLACLGPVVQVVRVIVATLAVGELGEDTLGVRCLTVTVLTPWHGFVLACMTLGTCKVVVLGRALGKHVEFPLMACATVTGWDIIRICYLKRHVCLVTLVAFTSAHVR